MNGELTRKYSPFLKIRIFSPIFRKINNILLRLIRSFFFFLRDRVRRKNRILKSSKKRGEKFVNNKQASSKRNIELLRK